MANSRLPVVLHLPPEGRSPARKAGGVEKTPWSGPGSPSCAASIPGKPVELLGRG